MAGTIAEINSIFSPRSRRGVYTNQAHVLPPETGWLQRPCRACAAFRYFGYSVVDFFRIPLTYPQNLDRFVAGISGWEHLRAAMEAGMGGVFVTVHMGSWERGGAYMGMRGVPLTVAVLSHQDPRIDQIFLESRLASGMEIVPLGGALRKLQDAVARLGASLVWLPIRECLGTWAAAALLR